MKKSLQPLPVDIALPMNTLSDEGTMFVVLPTLDALQSFWTANKSRFSYACSGISCPKPTFLREYEWVFGTNKAAVVRTVMRWEQLGVGCEFYDRASDDPEIHEAFFKDREDYRQKQMIRSKWTTLDEWAYRQDCQRRSRETYRGWWQLMNLPRGYDPDTWFNPAITHEELIDQKMDLAEVARALQEQTFDDWKQSDVDQIEFHDRHSFAEFIEYWEGEKKAGCGYYGSENEKTTVEAFG